jgi:hypothetical protein
VARVLTAYDTSDSSTCGLINDLRCVVAKFMGRQEPSWAATANMIPVLKRRWGEWVTLDGGAIKIRLYKKGTAHMEVHPDMAWRLNSILASLHPLAIPAQFRQKPKKRVKEFEMVARPLPFNVLELLGGMRVASERIDSGYPERFRTLPNTRKFDSGRSGACIDEASRIIQSIGGVLIKPGMYFQFDYDPTEVLDDIVCSGCIPDRKAHQYYPTPEKLARIAVEWADIGEADQCLEPSAGQGGIADYMPKDRTTCVEISALHCAVLKAKGFTALEGDFLTWAMTASRYDVIVMNPPFSEGRAKTHTHEAVALLKPSGRLVAILPASHKGMDFQGLECEWSGVYEREFAGTGTAVVMLKAVKASKECQ